MEEQAILKIFEYAVDYHFGALWWGAESFIKERFASWYQREDRIGHPLLSLRETPVTALCDAVPMLVGTTAHGQHRHSLLIEVTKEHQTDFSTQTASQIIFADDFLYHNDDKKIRDNPETPIWERRRLWPNTEKKRITDEEAQNLRAFLAQRKTAALQNGGWN